MPISKKNKTNSISAGSQKQKIQFVRQAYEERAKAEKKNGKFPKTHPPPQRKKEIRKMRERELREFQQILKYFPLVGVPIVELANITGIGYTTLYHYRNGLKPKEEKYRYIMEKIREHFPKELEKAKRYIQVDRELEQEENE